MTRTVFEVTIVGPNDDSRFSDKDEEDNLVSCILDGLGFPNDIQVSAKVLRRWNFQKQEIPE